MNFSYIAFYLFYENFADSNVLVHYLTRPIFRLQKISQPVLLWSLYNQCRVVPLPLFSLKRLVTEKSWKKRKKNLMFDIYTEALCIVFALSLQPVKLSSSYPMYIGNRIPVLMVFTISSPVCLTMYWFCKEKLDFDHFCKLMNQKTSTITLCLLLKTVSLDNAIREFPLA